MFRSLPSSRYVRRNSRLLFTEYILKFIDDPLLRQHVQKALNRGEAYHRFRRAIAFVNGGKFRVKTEEEQHIWNECSRLIANAIIYYNTRLLSKVDEQKLAAGDAEAIDMMRAISPIAWQHINLFGTFEFNPASAMVDINALVAIYADAAYWSQVAAKEVASTEGADTIPRKRKRSANKPNKARKSPGKPAGKTADGADGSR